MQRAPFGYSPGHTVGKGHPDFGEGCGVLAFKNGMRAHGSIVTEAGFLGVVAVRIGIVRRAECRIDDEFGEIARVERGCADERDPRIVGIAPGIVVLEDGKVARYGKTAVMLIGKLERDPVGAEGQPVIVRAGLETIVLAEGLPGANVERERIVPGIANELARKLSRARTVCSGGNSRAASGKSSS